MGAVPVEPTPPAYVTANFEKYVNAPTVVAEPPAVVMTTFFAPSVPAGVVIEMAVEVLLTIIASLPSIVTEVAELKLVPLITVEVPPAVVPSEILSEVIVGDGVET
jgi:hypothetical protein